jgi:pseudaminic acid cytidylyltransferase
MEKTNHIAIIPARGGSKRIKDKNIKSFCGRPIIAYPIEEIRKSGLFSRLIVSTDSPEIASVAESLGAEAPFTRPGDLSDDHTPLAEVVAHALDWYRQRNEAFDYACCVLATSPFIQAEHILAGYELISKKKVGSVVAVTGFDYPILRSFRINEEGFLEMQWPEHESSRSNDLPDFYHDAGQFYWLDALRFMEHKRIFCEDALPVILPNHMVQDIDTIGDWKRAELLFEILRKEKSGS